MRYLHELVRNREMTAVTLAMMTLVSILLGSCAGEPSKTESQESPPGIILLMGDDHGWDEVGYQGHPHIKTPVLDEMGADGLRFDRFYAAHPSCSPTRGSCMTGRHPNRYGTFAPNWSIRPEEISVAQILKNAGYVCAHYGKWHLGPVKHDSPTSPGALGFDQWLSHDNFFEMDPTLSENGQDPERFEGEGSEVIVQQAIRFIDEAKKQAKPFFVVIWFGSPHEPYSGLPEDLKLYDDLPAEYSHKSVRLTSNETGQPVERPLRDVLQERYAEITAMDRSIGTLRDYLQAEGLQQNTMLWYCGDNGTPPSAARTGMTLRGQKGTMYEGGIRVPAVIEWPAKIAEGRLSTVHAVTSDILPTLCHIVGESLPVRPLDGIDLTPIVEGTLQMRSEPIFFWSFGNTQQFGADSQPYIDPALQEGTTPLTKMMAGKYTRTFRNFHYPAVSEQDISGARVMMDHRFKLILGESGDNEGIELFDLVKDPAEIHNLKDAEPEVVEAMQKELNQWQQSVLNSLTGADYL